MENDEALLRTLSFWRALQGLEESTSDSDLVVAVFARNVETTKTVIAAGLWLLSPSGIQPLSAQTALRYAARLADSSVAYGDSRMTASVDVAQQK